MMLEFQQPVILIGNGEVNAAQLRALESMPVLAVDGGANWAIRNGYDPDFVLGDFDSLETSIAPEKRITLPDQNHTDFAKALAAIDAPVIYAFGFFGQRLDHSLDALARLAEETERQLYLVGNHEVAFIWRQGMMVELEEGCRVSYWSAGEAQVQSSLGLEWDLGGTTITPSTMSISNAATGGMIAIDYGGDPLIAMIDVTKFKF